MRPPVLTPAVTAVMVHVSCVDDALVWYEQVFPGAVRSSVDEPAFEFLRVGEVRLELVAADAQVSSGACGSVVYWEFADFEAALARFLAAGAVLYRGPMLIEDGRRMCQVRDPWGNCIGLRGPSSAGLLG
ncbi:MAG: hypothetical protein RL375_3635 [Pseudomonadota bacterium]